MNSKHTNKNADRTDKTHSYNSRLCKVEARGLEIQSHPHLYSKFKTSLGNVSPVKYWPEELNLGLEQEYQVKNKQTNKQTKQQQQQKTLRFPLH